MSTTLINTASIPSSQSHSHTQSHKKRTLQEFQSFDLDSTLKEVQSLFKKPKFTVAQNNLQEDDKNSYRSLFSHYHSSTKNEYLNQLKTIRKVMINFYVDDLVNRDSLDMEIQNELVYNEDGLFLQNDVILNNLVNIVSSNRD